MKIIYKVGDALKASEGAFVHGCNAQGIMGSGIAKQFKTLYPRSFENYKRVIRDCEMINISPMGMLGVDNADGKMIICAITQEFYGKDGSRYVSYDAIADAMQKINGFLREFDVKDIAMPRIGAGLGGGNWNIISSIIEECLTDVQPVVYDL